MQEMHCQNVNPMGDDVAMAEVIFWMFPRAGFKYKSSVTNKLCVWESQTQNCFWDRKFVHYKHISLISVFDLQTQN